MIQAPYVSIAICLLAALVSGAQPCLAAEPPFTHPGILHSRAELDFVRAKVAEGQEPWKAAWEALRREPVSSLTWKPKPAADVVRGPYNNPDIGGTDLMRDAAAAYSHAIQWYVTSERAHADKAIEILDAYATRLKSIGGHDAKLLAGMVGINFANAAEIIRHTSAGWSDAEQQVFALLLGNVLYPIIKDFYPTANGNWDAAMIQTMLAMGVYLDDREMFQRGLDERVYHHYRGRMGLEMPFTGQVVETNRPEVWQAAFASWGTLLYAGQPVEIRSSRPTGPE